MDDRQAIREAALDYIQGWYTADASRMDRALSPDLAKRRMVSSAEVWQIDKEQMVKITGAGRGRLEHPESGRQEITILDRTETMASVKVVAEKFSDYLHLAKLDGAWSIVNVLWDFHAAET